MIKAVDDLYHRLALKLHRDFWFPGVNWICDRHEHNLTGLDMAELRRERRNRRAE